MISDAARAKKMLLSLDGEINYIRKSTSLVSRLIICRTTTPQQAAIRKT